MSGGSLSAAAGVPAASSSTGDDDHHLHHGLALAAADVNLLTLQDRKDQAMLALKADSMEKLNKEVKSLDEDSWMFDGPRSRFHLISKPRDLPAQEFRNDK
ncbi:protein SAMBA [Andrographis paniculata]|uniref:protein SAMBA n=1 Tax=Andrographis paniculata TaxID=175694 RepID=UPI0021E965C2|nr:protein SAMBA [Andrographis paniculata]